MKSKLKAKDTIHYRSGGESLINSSFLREIEYMYNDDLTDKKGYTKEDIIRVTRNGEIIWQRDEPIDINNMSTVIHNGVTYPLATHENMKILVDRISELEKEISNLKQGK